MTADFIDLHTHSTFSSLDAFGTVKQLVSRSKEIDRKALAITDHGVVSGLAKLEKLCRENEIKPIFGCEFYAVSDASEKNSPERFHLTILARNQEGYRNMMTLVTRAYKEGFYYKPRIDPKLLSQHSEGLVVLSGCYSSPICGKWRSKDYGEAYAIASRFKRKFKQNFFLEMQPLDLTYGYNLFLSEMSSKLGIPLVMTNDVHFVLKGQDRIQRLLHLIRGTDESKSSSIPTQYLLDKNEITELVAKYEDVDWKSAIANTSEIASRVDVTIPRSNMITYPEGEAPLDVLKKKCYASEVWRKISDRQGYRERLEYELDIIDKKDFSSYFVLISDICEYMRRNDILVGPGRGSAAGSLVCFVLKITRIDPIEHGLMFERFLDINRTDYPDIDIDIESERIKDVKAYTHTLFPPEQVASIATFSEFKGKSILGDLGRVYKIPSADLDVFKDRIIEYSDADARYSFGIQDTIKKFPEVQAIIDKYPQLKDAEVLEGQYRHMGQHAAGLVVSSEPLTKNSALYTRNDEELICWDKTDFEYMNLLKIDLLKLKTLDVLKEILRQVGWSTEDLYKIPLDDPKVFQAFKSLDMLGIFQFDGYSAYWVLSQVNVNGLIDLSHVNALGRPGPIFSRAAHRFIKAQKGIMEEAPIPELAPFVKDSGGEIIYQEQVMSILREMAGFSWSDTSKIRKIIAKSMGQEGFNKFRNQFIEGCSKNGYSEEVAGKIWDRMATFGSWAFNKSHAMAYAVIGYLTMYFKLYYPQEFYFANLIHESDEEKVERLLLKFAQYGQIMYPNVNKSDVNWSLVDGKLYAGLSYLKGLGPVAAREIIAHRPYRDLQDLKAKCLKRRVNSKIISLITDNNSFADRPLESKAFEIFKKYTDVDKVKDIGWSMSRNSVVRTLVCFVRKRSLYNQKQEDEIRGIKKEYKTDQLDFMVVNLEDDTGIIKAKIPAWHFEKYRDILMNATDKQLFKVRGKQPFEQRTLWLDYVERIS